MPPPLPLSLDPDSQSLARLPVALQAMLYATQYSGVSLHTLLGRDPHPNQSPLIEPRFRCQSPPCFGSKRKSGKSELTNKIMVGKTKYVISLHPSNKILTCRLKRRRSSFPAICLSIGSTNSVTDFPEPVHMWIALTLAGIQFMI
jgi:hypothetical protein